MNKSVSIDRFYLSMLRDYFGNIIAACENKKVDERVYIKTVAKCGLDIITKELNKTI